MTAPIARLVISRIVALSPPAMSYPDLTSEGVAAFAVDAVVGPLLLVLFATTLFSFWPLWLTYWVVGTVEFVIWVHVVAV